MLKYYCIKSIVLCIYVNNRIANIISSIRLNSYKFASWFYKSILQKFHNLIFDHEFHHPPSILS